jgi:hypothetical protein
MYIAQQLWTKLFMAAPHSGVSRRLPAEILCAWQHLLQRTKKKNDPFVDYFMQ